MSNEVVESDKYMKLKKYIPEITEWIREGVPRVEVAKRLGIGYATFLTWSRKYKEFGDAVDLGIELSLDDIEASLYLSCKPQRLSEEWYDESGNLTKKFIKTIPANQRAIEYNLNNRRPDKWKADTKSIDISLSEQMREKFKDMDIQDIVALANLDVDAIADEDEVAAVEE